MTDQPPRKLQFGVTPTEVMASMAGIDFLRAIFAGKLPSPPIMPNIEPFAYSVEPGVVSFSSIPGIRHYNPIGSVHGGYAATLLDSAMGLCVHSMLPAGSGYTTLEFKISFIPGVTPDTGAVRQGLILPIAAGSSFCQPSARNSNQPPSSLRTMAWYPIIPCRS